MESLTRMPMAPQVFLLAFATDAVAPPEDARLLAEALGRRAEMNVLPGSGHRPYYARDLAAFVSALTGLGP